ncbi:MAG: endolytic transglycosylase MltG, partial [Pseudomonadota bacterium]|nr:endolytic transglycosylase MltG [Pseudomonadota bacterium]
GPLTEPKTVVIPRGTNIRDIAVLLEKNDAISNAYLFRIAAHFMANNDFKAGEYLFTPPQSAADIILMLREGRSVVHAFTVTEGMTSAEAVRLLQDTPALAGAISAAPPEGSLLPETYNYSLNDTRSGLIARMQKAMQETREELWAKRDPLVPITTPAEAITMASIVEKETGKPSERPRIAGVFYNRLHLNMRLQSDPTVIYAIVRAKGLLDHDIDHTDLSFASPFNTYMTDGLPPAPICNPGRAAIEAALHPEKNDYLYFVADGTGGHVFARDLPEHNQNVTRWHQVRPK